tara:strand:- start:437 stop:622 length:186 start_codon:yes stop_codon:yes gene_type:complete
LAAVPNQRDPDKQQLRTWMHIKDVELLRSLAEREGLELGDFLSRIAEERNKELKKHDQKNN